MDNTLINLAVIGHTNVGKTSLLRTLTRNDDIGEVKNASATTRHVEKIVIGDDNTALVALYDTPGLEDATGIMDYLDEFTDSRQDGVARLQIFLDDFDRKAVLADFAQEVKVIKTVLNADIGLYVIDVRQQPTAKYQDELAILTMSGTPILPVFNFIADSRYFCEWQSTLSRRAIHVYNVFDTVAFEFTSEIKLWQNLGTLSGSSVFDRLIGYRTNLWQDLQDKGNYLIADFLVNIASFAQKSQDSLHDNPKQNAIIEQYICQKFHQTCDRLMNLYQFYHHHAQIQTLCVDIKKIDVFDKSLLPQTSLKTMGAVGVGAIIGAGIDVLSLGTSLGAGTVLGSLLGGGSINYQTIKDKLNGVKYYRIDDTTINIMAGYLADLHKRLRHTGHAKIGDFDTLSPSLFWQDTPIAIVKARQKPHISDLIADKHTSDKSSLRQDLTNQLITQIFTKTNNNY